MWIFVCCCVLLMSVDADVQSRYRKRPMVRSARQMGYIREDGGNNEIGALKRTTPLFREDVIRDVRAARFVKRRSATKDQELAALSRRLWLVEEDYEQCETNRQGLSARIEQTSRLLVESAKKQKLLETSSATCKEQLAEVTENVTKVESMYETVNKKHEDALKKLAVTEVDLERAEARVEAGNQKITELEEELRVVGNNLKSMEKSEEEAAERERGFEESNRDLVQRLRKSEDKANTAEATVIRLQKQIDVLEDELIGERMKNKDQQSSIRPEIY